MPEYNLIVTIVNKGKADEVMEACGREAVRRHSVKRQGQGIPNRLNFSVSISSLRRYSLKHCRKG